MLRLPKASLSSSVMFIGMLSLAYGTILGTVTLGRQEAKCPLYLCIPRARWTDAP